jgi:glycosyltransferase involved in cell wall biosynthesis
MLLENDLFPQDTRVRDEAQSLANAGYRVHVIAPRGKDQPFRELIEGVEVERFRLPTDHRGGAGMLLIEYALAHIQLYFRALREIVRGTDVLHVHNPPDTLFLPALVGRPVGCKLVFDQHDLFPELFQAKYGRSPLRVFARTAQWLSLRVADLVITTNESQRASAMRGVRRDKTPVIVVRNGPPAGLLPRAISDRPGPLNDPRLVYVGALGAQDGVDWLPELITSLREDHGVLDPTLTVVGWGTRETRLLAEVKARGLMNRVCITGRVNHRRALELIADADICLDVAPCDQLNHRTTMVKISEYLALGKPTVSYALHETMQTAGDAVALARCGDHGHFVALVAELAKSQTRRDELRARALALAPSLVWERSEHTLLDGYRSLCRPAARDAMATDS